MAAVFSFALALAFAGGLIAFMGDRLGTYIGKRRLALGRLRPRHTATLVTIVSGGLIAVVTLLFLLFYDYNVRFALLHGQQIRNTNSLLIHQNWRLAHADAVAESKVREKEAAAAIATNDALSARDGLRRAQQDLSHKRTALTQAQRDLASAQRSVALATQNVTLARQQLSQAQAQVAVTNSTLRQLRVRQSELTQHNQLLAMTNKKLEAGNSELKGSLKTTRTATILYRKDQEIGRTVIAANQPLTAIRGELETFLDELDRAVEERGGRRSGSRGAVLLQPPPQSGAGSAVTAAYSEDDILDALAASIARQSRGIPSVVILARALANTFRGDQARLDLTPYDNLLIFSKGETIASQIIDGTQPEEKVLLALQAFLAEKVRPEALRRGVIPVRDPLTGEKSVGAPIAPFELSKQIQQIGSTARVTATADEDTYSSGPLRLKLTVQEANAPQASAP